jgi:acyl-CoA thioester hydrolase
MALADLLKPYPVVITQAVLWGEMDAFHHVNNTAYFRYAENARIAYVEALGQPTLMSGTAIGPVLASISCRFRLPLTYPDTISVGARVTSLQTDRFTMQHVVVSHTLERVATEFEGLIVMFDFRTQRKVAISDELRTQIAALEARAEERYE